MSLNRLMLRLSAVTAAAGFWQAPYPTLAGRLVYDSKVEPIENFKVDKTYPTIVVYTDYDMNHIPHQDLMHTSRTMTITFELLMAVMSTVETADGEEALFQMGVPTTDTELEANLDVMEHQLFASLRANNAAAHCFNTIAYGMDKIVSRRGATTEGGTKIAARQVTYEAKVLQEMALATRPAFMTDFLSELEASDGYQELAPAIEALYTINNDVGAVERLRQTMGWTEEVRSKLGYADADAPMPPLNRTWHWLDQNGNPM